MDVYFVRHGETDCNRHHIHQSPGVPLSNRGREQSVTVAEYLRKVNPDYLITSDYTRALETARIMEPILGLTLKTSDLFQEVRRPAHLYGKSHFSLLAVWYAFQSVLHRGDFYWHYHDAENFMDIRRRVKDALTCLKGLKEDHRSIVVVSHSIFLNLLIAYMCKNRPMKLRDLLPALLHITRFQNGGVVHVRYIGETEKDICNWQLESYWKGD